MCLNGGSINAGASYLGSSLIGVTCPVLRLDFSATQWWSTPRRCPLPTVPVTSGATFLAWTGGCPNGEQCSSLWHKWSVKWKPLTRKCLKQLNSATYLGNNHECFGWRHLDVFLVFQTPKEHLPGPGCLRTCTHSFNKKYLNNVFMYGWLLIWTLAICCLNLLSSVSENHFGST